MQDVKNPPHTERRGNQWWYRRRVPTQLSLILGRNEYRESLKTSDVEVARTRAAIKDAEVAIEFEKAKEQLKRQAVVTPVPVDLSQEDQSYISEAVRTHILEEDEITRVGRPTATSLDGYEGFLSDWFEGTGKALRTGDIAVTRRDRERVADLLNAVGLSVAPNSPAWGVTAYKVTEGINRALQDIRSRLHGAYVPTPQPPQVPPSLLPREPEEKPVSAGVVTLGEVIDHYLQGLPENGFKRKVKRCLELFGEMLGRGLPVSDLKQRAVTQFMRDICQLPAKWALRFDAGASVASMLAEEAEKVMSPTTYEGNYRGPLGSFLTSAAQNFGDEGMRLLSVEGIRYTGNRVAEEDQQRALYDNELKVLFEGEAFARVANNPKDEPLYWLLAVLLFTGARPREICQINPQVDFGELEGAWYIDLDNKSPAGLGVKKTIKTGESRRLPIHAELMRLGFVEYLQRQKAAGADRLFLAWRVKGGNPFTAHYDRVASLLRETGLYTRDASPGEQITGAYVLRKTFITQCRNQGVVSKEITGHSDGSTTQIQDRHYIFGKEPLLRKVSELSKLVMPVQLPLPRVAR